MEKVTALKAHNTEHSRCREWSSASAHKASQRGWKVTGASHSNTEGTHLKLGDTQTRKGKCIKFGRGGWLKANQDISNP